MSTRKSAPIQYTDIFFDNRALWEELVAANSDEIRLAIISRHIEGYAQAVIEGQSNIIAERADESARVLVEYAKLVTRNLGEWAMELSKRLHKRTYQGEVPIRGGHGETDGWEKDELTLLRKTQAALFAAAASSIKVEKPSAKLIEFIMSFNPPWIDEKTWRGFFESATGEGVSLWLLTKMIGDTLGADTSQSNSSVARATILMHGLVRRGGKPNAFMAQCLSAWWEGGAEDFPPQLVERGIRHLRYISVTYHNIVEAMKGVLGSHGAYVEMQSPGEWSVTFVEHRHSYGHDTYVRSRWPTEHADAVAKMRPGIEVLGITCTINSSVVLRRYHDGREDEVLWSESTIIAPLPI